MADRAFIRGENEIRVRGLQIPDETRDCAYLAGGDRKHAQNARVVDDHREQLIRADSDVFCERLRGNRLALQELLVLPTVSEVRDNSGQPCRARVANRVREEEVLDNHRVRVSRLHEDNVLPVKGREQANVSLSVRKTAGVPFKAHVNVARAKLAGEGPGKEDGRGATYDLHRVTRTAEAPDRI